MQNQPLVVCSQLLIDLRHAGSTSNTDTGVSLLRCSSPYGAFFDPETDMVRERLAGWVKGMESAYRAYPDDLDVASLYALSRMAPALPSDDRKTLHNEAEQVLREAWKTEPTHPGAVHSTTSTPWIIWSTAISNGEKTVRHGAYGWKHRPMALTRPAFPECFIKLPFRQGWLLKPVTGKRLRRLRPISRRRSTGSSFPGRLV